jgi:hypothetical protein
MKRLSILLFSLLFSVSAFSQQIKEFTHEDAAFIKELEGFFVYTNEDKAEKIMEVFLPVWQSGAFSQSEKQRIFKMCNLMLKKRKKAFPDYENYVYTLISFARSMKTGKTFEAFHVSLDGVLNTLSRKQFSAYMQVCKDLFTDKTLFTSTAVTWKTNTDLYVLSFDSIPKITFPKCDLSAYSKRDSAIIHGTEGVYMPTLKQFVGKGGMVDWTRAGFEGNKVYAELGAYTLDISKPGYSAKNVTFYNPDYLDGPQKGTLTEKILADVKEGKASYPRFDSENKRIFIGSLYENIDYDGGFSQHGVKFLGSGDKDQDAILTFKRINPKTGNPEPMVVAKSKSFVIKKDKILSERAKIFMPVREDSISHPGIKLNYNVEAGTLTLTRTKEGAGRSPFFNSFHKVEMDFESLNWKMSESVMEMKNITANTESEAKFESEHFFDEFRYDRMRGVSDVNPLKMLKDLTVKQDTNVIHVSDVARHFKSDISTMKIFLMNMSNSGFMTYDYDEHKITVKPKLIHYVVSRAGRKDYDAIQFNSVIKGLPNARLELDSFHLQLNGVGRIFMSDSQNVIIFPYEQRITVKKNRNFDFAGKIKAGRLDFFGKDFSFDYDQFKFNLNQIDSLRLKVPDGEPDDRGRVKLKPVKTVLRDMKGDLLIDRPDNKSGLVDHPRYPVFNSKEDSYVYYNSRGIQNGAYKKEEFYMHLEPFSIDSLDNFTKEGLEFKGEFISAGIFPTFDETLRLQPDFSLGFVRETPPDGYEAYGGKGKFTSTINLSNQGLRGDGTIDYLTSTAESMNWIFLPDSTIGLAQTFEIKPQVSGVEYPSVTGVEVNVLWYPKADHYYATSVNNPFDMYDKEVIHAGMLDLSPQGLEGAGDLDFADAKFNSNRFDFENRRFVADTTDFRLNGVNSDKMAFSTNNVYADIDLDKRIGKFKSNTGGDFVDFPVNQYICFIDQFQWNIDAQDIDIVSLEGEGSRFVSTKKGQDSLDWRSPLTKFDLEENVITAWQVSHIDVADAIIHPDSGLVIIRPDANMDPLLNAGIVANRITKYHTFYDATVNVLGKYNYNGSGKLDYTDVTGKKQSISFESIRLDSAKQTYGEGQILSENDFTLSPNFDFKGKAKLFASKQFLTYSGSTRIKHNCGNLTRDWLAFEADIDPEEIYIPIEAEPKDANGKPLASGVVLSKDSTTVYPTFLSLKRNSKDVDIVAASGYLHFDNESGEYRISSREKLRGEVVGGNYVSLSEDCIARGEGLLNLGIDLGQVKLTPLGSVKHNMNNDSTNFNLYLGLDFMFNRECQRIMADKIANHFPPLDAIYYGVEYEKALIELIGKEKTTKALQDLNLYGTFKKMPKELEKTLMLSDVKLTWNPSSGSYRYKGFIGISSTGEFQINKSMFGMIELQKKRNGDRLNIYFEPSDNVWFFYTYQRGIMASFSSEDGYNSAIREMKPDKRKAKSNKDGDYQYILSTEIKKRNFVRSFEEEK